MIALPLLLFDLCFVGLVFRRLPHSSSWRHCGDKSRCYGELRIFINVEIQSAGTGTSPCLRDSGNFFVVSVYLIAIDKVIMSYYRVGYVALQALTNNVGTNRI